MDTYTLNAVPFTSTIEVISDGPPTEAEFWSLVDANPDLRFERTRDGTILITPPRDLQTGSRNARLNAQLTHWAIADQRGQPAGPSTGFKLPNGAIRMAAASWLPQSRIDVLTPAEKAGLPNLCPDFVVELVSAYDGLSATQQRMREWIDNGAQLGWLLDPDHRTVHIYRPNRDPDVIVGAKSISGDPPIHGFTLDLEEIWAGV